MQRVVTLMISLQWFHGFSSLISPSTTLPWDCNTRMLARKSILVSMATTRLWVYQTSLLVIEIIVLKCWWNNHVSLYIAGTAAHSLDFRRSAGGFIHGFRYTSKYVLVFIYNSYTLCVSQVPPVNQFINRQLCPLQESSFNSPYTVCFYNSKDNIVHTLKTMCSSC